MLYRLWQAFSPTHRDCADSPNPAVRIRVGDSRFADKPVSDLARGVSARRRRADGGGCAKPAAHRRRDYRAACGIRRNRAYAVHTGQRRNRLRSGNAVRHRRRGCSPMLEPRLVAHTIAACAWRSIAGADCADVRRNRAVHTARPGGDCADGVLVGRNAGSRD